VVGASTLNERSDDPGQESALALDLTSGDDGAPDREAPAARPTSSRNVDRSAPSSASQPGADPATSAGSDPAQGTTPSTDGATGAGGDGSDGGEEQGAPAGADAAATTTPSGAPPAGSSGSRCADSVGESTTEGQADIDLAAVELRRSDAGLRIRFELAGPLSADAGQVGGAPATNMWQVLLASGDAPIYGFSVTQQGTAWETNLVDFESAEGDRLTHIDTPSGTAIEAIVPTADLPNLPASFTWWALTNSDRRPPAGAYLGDDCPDATGAVESAAELPPESARVNFP
jgi:hypothetical protein